ncbi:MAG TPA: hypothetical protein VIL36_16575 [Acidimicrobiales bacterium]
MPDGQGRRRLATAVPQAGKVALVGALVVGPALGLAACGGDGGDDPDDSAEEVLESAGARGLAEALRVLLVIDEPPEGLTRREITVIQEAVDDLPEPFEPDIEGLVDEDGDGLDDDGKFEVRVDTELACVSIGGPDDIDVTGGAC